jgi:hypothetical protein
MPEQDPSWYVRIRGKVLGPFTRDQLESMRDRGQIARFHEVSQDRRTWASAASLSELFPPSGSERTPSSHRKSQAEPVAVEVYDLDLDDAGAVGQEAEGWYYSRGGSPQGPISFLDLQRLASQGEVAPETLVWKAGLPNWIASRKLPEYGFTSLWAPSVSTQSTLRPVYEPGSQIPAGVVPRTSGLAVASLVLGILWLCGVGSLLATIFGGVALSQISRSNGALTGKGMAVAGLVLGIIGLAFIAFLFFAGVIQNAVNGLPQRRW